MEVKHGRQQKEMKKILEPSITNVQKNILKYKGQIRSQLKQDKYMTA